MKPHELEALYFTRQEVEELLGVSKPRVYHLRDAGFIDELKGGIYSRASVEAYKAKRGDKKGGPYRRVDSAT
ncbi:MAG: helix-turn-helix domain-containing protein [Coriobacteriales bacterium]|jgi:hypothetical protein|nr:helix-turn-helix domain-containing protein [Coriobacteriales bacterium]